MVIKKFIKSPNYDNRSLAIRRIILHSTASNNVNGTIAWFQNPNSKVSAHYIIDKNGDIYQMVMDDKRAWHAKGENNDSIGIELVALPNEIMTKQQERALVGLLRYLMTKYGITKSNITGHKFTLSNKGRTTCPNMLFGDTTEKALRDWVDRSV